MSKILIVDDQPELRSLFSRVVEHQGHVVIAAANGQEALALLDSFAPDLMLMDLAMPQMDGLTLLRTLRGNPRWAKLPVIMLSGLMTPEQLEIARELGVADQLLKGEFSTRDLRARVAHHLSAVAA